MLVRAGLLHRYLDRSLREFLAFAEAKAGLELASAPTGLLLTLTYL